MGEGTGGKGRDADNTLRPSKPLDHKTGNRFPQQPQENTHTSLEGTTQARLAIPLVVTDGPIATFGGLLGAVTPGTQLVSTALTVSGA